MLQDKFVLVSLNVSSLSFRKQEKGVANEVLASHNAERGSGNFWKRLFPEYVEKEVSSLTGSARNFLFKHTLPSGVEGLRLLKIVQRGRNVLIPLQEEMCKFQDQFEDLKRRVLAQYDSLVDEMRSRLGDLFNEKDYLRKSDLARKFGMRFTVIPIDSSLEVFKTFETAAREDCLAGVSASFDLLAKNLAQPDKVFKSTVVDTMKGFVDRFAEFIPAHMLDRIEDFTEKFDADACREDPSVRKETAEVAGRIVVDISDLL